MNVQEAYVFDSKAKVIVLCATLFGVGVASALAQTARQLDVAVITPSVDDPGVLSVREAVTFWNRTFSELGIPLHLTEPRLEVAPSVYNVFDKYVRQMDASTNETNEPQVSREMLDLHKRAEIVVFLSQDQEHISWGGPYGAAGTFPGLIAMRSASIFPLNLPNAGRNTVAHEVGHALGLSHNADDSTLMCGRPAECRPARHESLEVRFFPLTDDDRATLRRLHGSKGR